MVRVVVALTFALCLRWAHSTTSEECEKKFFACYKDFQKIDFDSEPRKFLTDTCPVVKAFEKCINSTLTTCGEHGTLRSIELLIESSKRVFESGICEPGKTQDDFLNGLRCFFNVEKTSCKNETANSKEKFEKAAIHMLDGPPVDARSKLQTLRIIEGLCCSSIHHKKCLEYYMPVECSEQEVKQLQTVDGMREHLLREHCEPQFTQHCPGWRPRLSQFAPARRSKTSSPGASSPPPLAHSKQASGGRVRVPCNAALLILLVISIR